MTDNQEFEKNLWATVDKLRNNMDTGEYKKIVLTNGSMTINAGTENEIKKRLIIEGLVDCMVALPTQLFDNTQIPACLWFLARNPTNHKFRNRSGEILFIDARKLGTMTSCKNKSFEYTDITQMAEAYHNWRKIDGKYEDVQGFCKSANLTEEEANNFVFTPGRYVGTKEVEGDGIPFEEKVATISENRKGYFEKSLKLQQCIKTN